MRTPEPRRQQFLERRTDELAVFKSKHGFSHRVRQKYCSVVVNHDNPFGRSLKDFAKGII
jgi:hypothetical protein